MKRWIAAALLLSMMITMFGCADSSAPASTDPSPAPTEPTHSATVPTITQTDPPPTDTEPVPTFSSETNPSEPTLPAPTETVPTEPQPTQPQPTDPPVTQPPATEPPVTEPPEPDQDLLVNITDYLPDVQLDLRYASERNFTGNPLYDFSDAYLRYGTVKKLMEVREELAQQGIGLLVWDAFRPLKAQAMLWQVLPDATFVSNPVNGNRTHSRGSAIDLTLVDLQTGQPLEMPSDFDDFTPLGDHDYSDCTETAAANAALLRAVMEKHGFLAYSGEWWHYSDSDTYEIEQYFDPAMPRLWYATCNSSMSLRKSANKNAASIAKIYPNDTMELLGWSGYFAYVRFQGKEGYVLSNYIKPCDTNINEILGIVDFSDAYSYEMMLEDLKAMAEKFPEIVVLDSIGQSELGRDLPVLRIGNENAENHILFQAAIHGNEYVTSWLIMAMVDYGLHHGMAGYGDICFHVIPMMNPDGVTTVLTRELSELQLALYEQDKALGYMNYSKKQYAINWKANGLGVDLNRNFDAKWDTVTFRDGPSYMRYRGTEPFSAAEAKALRDYTLRYPFDATFSYHSMGSIIFDEFGSNKEANALSKKLGKAISAVTGYGLVGPESQDAGGYKDWCIDKLSIPSLTVEIGTTRPVDLNREAYSLFYRHYDVFAAAALWVQR